MIKMKDKPAQLTAITRANKSMIYGMVLLLKKVGGMSLRASPSLTFKTKALVIEQVHTQLYRYLYILLFCYLA